MANPIMLTEEFFTGKEKILYICAGGFEYRCREIIKTLLNKPKRYFSQSLIFEYESQKEDNKENLEYLLDSLKRLSENSIPTLIDPDNPLQNKKRLIEVLNKISGDNVENIFIDITGMANFLIIQAIAEVKNIFWDRSIYILYTEAGDYYPSKENADNIAELIEKNEEISIEKLSEIYSSTGVKETLILPDFNGKFTENLPICLIFFVGYEPIRSKGLIEQYYPNLIIACYGDSPHEKFKWRTEFSRKIHEKVFSKYPHIKDSISTFTISEMLEKLENIYNYNIEGSILYEKYNICVTPQCSKLQAVATYIFAHKHPDVQILYCLPGKFNPKNYPNNAGNSWVFEFNKLLKNSE